MAQQTVVTLIDDLEGGKAQETVSFSINGTAYEIDLNARNAKKLEKALLPFIECARVTQKPRRARRVNGRANGHNHNGHGKVDPKVVRAWAAENGVQVPAKGRVPMAVVEQYQAAN